MTLKRVPSTDMAQFQVAVTTPKGLTPAELRGCINVGGTTAAPGGGRSNINNASYLVSPSQVHYFPSVNGGNQPS